MATLLTLVHSPLVGPATWDAVTPLLRNAGFEVTVPDLTGTFAAGPPYVPRQAQVVADAVGPRSTVLVGHSGAGPLLPAIAASLNHVTGLVYVDAGLAHPGRSWYDEAPADLIVQLAAMADHGWLPPWPQWWDPQDLRELLPDAGARDRFVAECPPLPTAMFDEVHPTTAPAPEGRSAYLRLSAGYQESAGQARAAGWRVRELDSNHLGVLTDPEAVAGVLVELVGG